MNALVSRTVRARVALAALDRDRPLINSTATDR
jgi:hypothetical protein